MARQLDPVTGAPVDWTTDLRNPGYTPGVAPAYDKKTTATFGDPVPKVFGTAKVKGTLVWMRDTASQGHIGWKYIGNETNGRFVPVDPHTDMVVGGTPSTTQFTLKDGGGATIPCGPYLGQLVYFWNASNPTLNGISRRITVANRLTDIITLDSALSATPSVGDFITVGPPVACRVADAIYAICEAPVTAVVRYFNGDVVPESTSAHLVAHDDSTRETVISGTAGTWPALEADTNAVGMTMSGTVQFRAKYLILDKDGKAPDLYFEVQAPATVDADPADVVVELAVMAGYSAGDVDVDLGSDGLAASSFRRYCSQMGFTVSRAITSQAADSTYLEELLDQCNAVPVKTGSKIRIVPLGDEVVGTYTPPSTAIALGVDDFVASGGEDPVSVVRRPDTEVWNAFSVTYQDRAADYAPVKVEYVDSADSTTNTVRRAAVVEGSWLANKEHAQKLASIKAQRSISIRNIYSFRIRPNTGALLEPMDLGSLTEPKLGLAAQVCRLKSIDLDSTGLLTVEAYEWPSGAASPVIITVQPYDGAATGAAVTPTGAPANNALPLLALSTLTNVPADSVTTDLIKDGTEWKSASLSAIGRTDDTATLVWYRGNCDPAVNGGAPVVCDGSGATNRLTLYSHGSTWIGDPIFYFTSVFDVGMQPQADTDNLDAIRYIEMQFWTAGSPVGTGSTLIDTAYLPFCDRKYRNATASDATNSVRVRLPWVLPATASGYYNGTSPYHFTGVVRLILHNAHGQSVTRDFNCNGITAGAAKGTAVTAQATSYNLGGSSPPAGGGSGGGGTCMDPTTPVLLSPDGATMPLHALRPGDLVWTRPEAGGELDYFAVDSVRLAFNIRQRVTLTDGRKFVCSVNHRIHIRGVWRRADSLQPGEEIDGTPSGWVKSVEYLGDGPVVQVGIHGAQTYYAGNGLWQHNIWKQT